jgi:hypothetical protein
MSDTSVIVFTSAYYIGGINVLDDENRTLRGYVNVDLALRPVYSKVSHCPLYRSRGAKKEFEYAVASVRDFTVITFLKCRWSMNAWDDEKTNARDEEENRRLLDAHTVELIRAQEDDGKLYALLSHDRITFEEDGGTYRAYYERLVIEDEDFCESSDRISGTNYFHWVREGGVSVYDSLERGRAEESLRLPALEQERIAREAADAEASRRRFEATLAKLRIARPGRRHWSYAHTARYSALHRFPHLLLSWFAILFLGLVLSMTSKQLSQNDLSAWSVFWLIAVLLAAYLSHRNLPEINYTVTDQAVTCFFWRRKSIPLSHITSVTFSRHESRRGTVVVRGIGSKIRLKDIDAPREVADLILSLAGKATERGARA